jgi:hypothetical protein
MRLAAVRRLDGNRYRLQRRAPYRFDCSPDDKS